ncbi:MlaD family protein [Patulibacter brassicae]|uniref:MlaD family protein n=1 Tax=Patulibacter brassicae TaxID=1705717 RepID=A0ABU4VQS4_9ACTN|nr:MlaD family protein [Patulibacter brassicae]MDX8153286.1 MlaD family protein [Patulibacter brassicae]
METGTPTWRAVLFPLVFALASAVVAIGLWRSFGGELPLQPRGYEVTVRVPRADALYANNDVRIAGVSVGRIKDVTVHGRRADVVLELDARFAPLRRDARVTVRSKSLLGEGYVEIAPGPRSAPAVPDGGRLSATRVQPTQRLEDALQTFVPGARRDIRGMAQGIARAFDGRADAANAAIGRTAPTVRNLDTVLDQLRGQDTALADMVRSSSAVFAAVGRRSSDLSAAITEGRAVLRTTAGRDRALEATVAELPAFLAALRDASSRLGDASGDLRIAAGSLRGTAPLLTTAVRAVNADLPEFRRLFDRLPTTLRIADRALPSAQRTLTVAGPALGGPYAAMRELIEFLQLASANTDEVVANFSNIPATINGVFRGPGGRDVHIIPAVLSVWNEIIGGYTKRLPTNTSNPYPKPGASRGLARDGSLRAYDCRHVRNPLIVPPTGGTPTCRTQGPWTFNGRTAYYPRLERAAP